MAEDDRIGRNKSKLYVNVASMSRAKTTEDIRVILVPFVCGLLITCLLVFLAYHYLLSSSSEVESEHQEQKHVQKEAQQMLVWMQAEQDRLQKPPEQKVVQKQAVEKQAETSPEKETHSGSIPARVLSIMDDVFVAQKIAKFKVGSQLAPVPYRETLPSSGGSAEHAVFFLHGAVFASKTWQNIKTLQLVAAMGYRAVAVDIPVFAQSKSAGSRSRRQFIEQFMKEVKLDRPVLIAPSMSGSFALPYVLHPDASTCTQRLRGFVPIAPVGTSSYSRADYNSCKVSTMILYGEKDSGAPVDMLKQMPNSKVFMMKDAGHACYVDDPDEWHRLLFNFLRSPKVFRD